MNATAISAIPATMKISEPIPPVCGIVTFLFLICLALFAASAFSYLMSTSFVEYEPSSTLKSTGPDNLA